MDVEQLHSRSRELRTLSREAIERLDAAQDRLLLLKDRVEAYLLNSERQSRKPEQFDQRETPKVSN